MTVTITGPSGREYECDSRFVLFGCTQPKVPTFHSLRTGCGDNLKVHDDSAYVPPQHAVKFGRPCKRCWP